MPCANTEANTRANSGANQEAVNVADLGTDVKTDISAGVKTSTMIREKVYRLKAVDLDMADFLTIKAQIEYGIKYVLENYGPVTFDMLIYWLRNDDVLREYFDIDEYLTDKWKVLRVRKILNEMVKRGEVVKFYLNDERKVRYMLKDEFKDFAEDFEVEKIEKKYGAWGKR